MKVHTFYTLIFDPLSGMLDGLIPMSFTNTPLTFPGTVGIGTTAVGVHPIKEVANVMGGRNIDVT